MLKDHKELLKRHLMALVLVAVAMAIRDIFLHDLGGRVPWLTFYPAVRADLEDALRHLDQVRIATIITGVAAYDQELADVMSNMNNDLQFSAMLKSLAAVSEREHYEQNA